MDSSAILAKTFYDEEEEHCSYAMQLATSSALPMVLNTIIRLKVLEIIAKAGPGAQLSPFEIAARLPSKNSNASIMLDRMLSLLASYSVLTCSAVRGGGGDGDNDDQYQRVYGLAPVAKYFLQDEDGASLGSLLDLLQDKVLMDCWYKLEPAVLEGGTAFNKMHGMHIFKYTGIDQKFNESFNKAMIHHTFIVVRKVLQCYKGFEHLKILVDVGGGLGVTLSMITSKYPNIKGINFDLPHVIQNAPAYPGVEHIGGDMFECVPKGDAIFMKWILHDWDDDHCLKLLKNCYKALPDNGKVIAVDAILPTIPDNSASSKSNSQMDMYTLAAYYPGGKERTEQEFLALANEAGFKGIRLECFTCNMWVMELYK
nr:O-methyltransferase 6 [Hamelia patens]